MERRNTWIGSAIASTLPSTQHGRNAAHRTSCGAAPAQAQFCGRKSCPGRPVYSHILACFMPYVTNLHVLDDVIACMPLSWSLSSVTQTLHPVLDDVIVNELRTNRLLCGDSSTSRAKRDGAVLQHVHSRR